MSLYRSNCGTAHAAWGKISTALLKDLRRLTEEFKLSISAGDLQLLNGNWYVTHSGLLRLSHRRHCRGISTSVLPKLCESVAGRWVFKATVYTSPRSKGFVGYGDADPSNVSSLVHGAEMRVAETRAVNRALRKAYGIGLCSVEELGSFSSAFPVRQQRPQNGSHPSANHGFPNGQPRLRDRLCLLIRQHHLDAALVKRYAAEYCGTTTLREASRDLVAAFISHLAEWASKDREGLISKLSSYAKSPEPEVHA